MWGTLLVLALVLALNPVRLGLTLLLISRPRPVQNLLVFWIGCLVEGIPMMLVPLLILHHTPMFKSFMQDLATSSAVRHIHIGMGLVALFFGSLIVVRSLLKSRQQVRVPALTSGTSTLVAEPNTPNAISRLLRHAKDAPTEGGSVFRRLMGRAHRSWESGSLWVAFVIGLLSGPAPDEALYILIFIVTAGTGLGAQAVASVVFVFAMLALVELALVSYVFTPSATQAVLQRLQVWTVDHRRKILVAMCVIAGISLVTHGVVTG